MIQYEDMRLTIPFLVLWVGQRCNMHCKDCSNLIPYNRQVLYSAGDSLKALSLLAHTAEIGRVQIQGGEPLTHPHLIEIIEGIAQLPIHGISLTTNGTVLFSEELIAVLKKYPYIEITVSNYSARRKEREMVLQQLSEHGIKHTLYNFLYGNGEWFYSGGWDEKKNENDTEVEQRYASCENKVCWTLANGKLAVCGKIITLSQRYNLEQHDADNILDVKRYVNLPGGGGSLLSRAVEVCS